ncbi:ribose-5-phosphate isomerase RpiA [Pantoea sp. Mhis]|uniref:ribose-5-phosphate isomerase RpiA n=1 Tax=Pantoea sp. Mhis TaxID=2576759 RepID=UPI0013594F79|nr:ribose-5-phosphate isomerase RpiA [Pantoea sp. Mhis]MXP56681.1 ribose-5-phosphate isomerase RpiA [Pantoea sp. Mhis]
MSQDKLKEAVAWAALHYIYPGAIVGIGSGSTVMYFIEALNTIKHKIDGSVSSSKESTIRLKDLSIPIFDPNEVDKVDVYVDSADEINSQMQMIKGGGGALTSEKIIAAMSKKFICIVDSSKQVDILGRFPLPIEVIPMARTYVARKLIQLGGLPEYRQNIITDNGNIILDVHNLLIYDPIKMEKTINNLPGVVTVGLFAIQMADVVLISTINGIKTVVK